MIDTSILKAILAKYKADFEKRWESECYKWKAVQHFQDNWDVDALNFKEMLQKSLSETGNLLITKSRFPRGMIEDFAGKYPEVVRGMFLNLFDESIDIVERIENFKNKSKELFIKCGYDESKSHYQDESTISIYLWLKYPEKYYIYRIRTIKNLGSILKFPYSFVQGKPKENYPKFIELYNKVCEVIQTDSELIKMVEEKIEGNYTFNSIKILTQDIGYYLYKDSELPVFWKISEGSANNGLSTHFKEENLKHKVVSIHKNTSSIGTKKISQSESFKNEIKIGDYFYLCYGNKIKLLGEITSEARESQTDEEFLERAYDIIQIASNNNPYTGYVKWWTPNANTTCIKVKNDDLRKFESLILEPYFEHSLEDFFEDINEEEVLFDENNFLKDIYISEEKYNTLLSLLEKKKNIILQGAPGVGKTYIAKRLAYAMMGEKDDSRIAFTQFHQNYTYENFMLGYKPTKEGFELQEGIFYKFCKKAEKDPDGDYFFIIDEINRGNISKILGELLMLIENNHRNEKLILSYNNEEFCVPSNLYIIGMMNTADRSLALIDYALRRRFSFFDLEPAFDSHIFKQYIEGLRMPLLNNIIDVIKELNTAIVEDNSLGKGFCIGHSYFCGLDKDNDLKQQLENIIYYDIIPMLNEYWFDDSQKVDSWTLRLINLFND